MEFVLNRDKTLSSILGHTIEFKKGQPTHVPFEMHAAVQAIGAIPVDDMPEEKTVEGAEPADPAARQALILAAFERMVKENKRGSFAAAGQPHAKALKDILGFKIDDKERDTLWLKFTQKGDE